MRLLFENCRVYNRDKASKDLIPLADELQRYYDDLNVQHGAALHLATLSHSTFCQAAISKQATVMSNLYAIEGKESPSLAAPHARSLPCAW